MKVKISQANLQDWEKNQSRIFFDWQVSAMKSETCSWNDTVLHWNTDGTYSGSNQYLWEYVVNTASHNQTVNQKTVKDI